MLWTGGDVPPVRGGQLAALPPPLVLVDEDEELAELLELSLLDEDSLAAAGAAAVEELSALRLSVR